MSYQNILARRLNRDFLCLGFSGNAKAEDAPTLMALCGAEGTIDGCHPNDFGFVSMAKAIGDVLKQL